MGSDRSRIKFYRPQSDPRARACLLHPALFLALGRPGWRPHSMGRRLPGFGGAACWCCGVINIAHGIREALAGRTTVAPRSVARSGDGGGSIVTHLCAPPARHRCAESGRAPSTCQAGVRSKALATF